MQIRNVEDQRLKKRKEFWTVLALFLGLKLSGLFLGRPLPDVAWFVGATVCFFWAGYTLQKHAGRQLLQFRFDAKVFFWLVGAIAYWYSTALWIWWGRGSPRFPLFLLNRELRVALFFDVTVVALLFGLAFELREMNLKNSANQKNVSHL